MKITTIKAYMLKEFMELYRTRLIVMVYLLPTMILLLFGYGIRMDVTHARVLIIDNDKSQYSNMLTSKFEHTKYFNAQVSQMDEQSALRLIKQAKKDAIVIIPSSFEKRLLHGQKSEIGVFVDASFPTRATTIESYIEGTVLDAASEVAKKSGLASKGLITLNQRTLFNQAMRDEDAIVPGLIGLVLLVAPAILAALLIVKEKEKGTIFNFYASPLSKGEFLFAKLFPAFLLHSANIFILFLLAVYVFSVPFRGSFMLYWLSSELYVLISLSIGMLISVITSRQVVAVVLTVIITIIPGFLYSGILMPISSMVGESYYEAHSFPVMYYNHIIYDTFLIGQGLSSEKNILYLFILTGFAVVLFTAGRLLLKKEMK
ncbi:ABC transporter permease [Sulfurimonas paralvinellae]|uniref:ABC transporter permease n=1 Tax=Sulfurimonas paralvinellae TaxID=317658 RepID=A0A7M1B682_9BACT|nr:ABC transporter permease [Sulfurimonas paralvinellae]QOP45237.1 ABC transporter permease [Sulfurimonas paralvinellae]